MKGQQSYLRLLPNLQKLELREGESLSMPKQIKLDQILQI
jgi:hypothetical protein